MAGESSPFRFAREVGQGCPVLNADLVASRARKSFESICADTVVVPVAVLVFWL
jgi:hypothetical protein